MDELRIEIWDLLYRSKSPKPISEIAEHIHQECDKIRAAVNHEWFTIVGDIVTISRQSQTP